MKKCLPVLIIILLMFLALTNSVYAENDILSTEQDVLDLFAEQKKSEAKEFTFTCDKDLFDRLMADNAALLITLEIKGGIGDARIRYYAQTCVIELSQIVYTDAGWAECVTEKDARQAVQDLLKGGYTDFTLLTSPELAKTLANNGNLKNYAAQAGFVSIAFSYYTNGEIKAKGAEEISLPYAVADDTAQFDAAVESFAEDELDEFFIVFTPSFYNELSDDREQLNILHATSMLDEYHYQGSNDPGMMHYTKVTYTDEPCVVCDSDEDVVDTISRMGSSGITAFRIYMVGDDFRSSLLESSLAHLHELEAQAGMSYAKTAYSRSTIYYSEANIVSDAVPLKTLEDALDYMTEKASESAEDITLFCAPDLFTELMGKVGGFSFNQDGMDPIYDLVSQSGIFDYDISTNRSSGAVMIHVKAYYPGVEILRALENEAEDELPERLGETLESARELADACFVEDNPLETARAIHDALCERIVYVDDEETEEDDTAIGALLNGEANCDGYSDAFYLTGTLAGLEIRYQHGDSLVKGFGMPAFGNAVTHMWNLLLLDDSWRMVDVTWDDNDMGPDYTWFNLGCDRASRTHIWNEEMTVEILEETDMDARPENEYAVHNENELAEAVNLAFARGEYFSLIFDDENYVDSEAALDLIRSLAQDSIQYSWGKEMRQLKVYPNEFR